VLTQLFDNDRVITRPTTAQTGIPHALTTDDEFEGYRIPAGTTVTWNHWAISHNENEYKDAERFYPDRFLDEDLDDVVKGHYGFGAGRSRSLILQPSSLGSVLEND
jgi:cytochrome P450